MLFLKMLPAVTSFVPKELSRTLTNLKMIDSDNRIFTLGSFIDKFTQSLLVDEFRDIPEA